MLVIECLHVTEPGTATKKSGVRDQGSGIRGKKEEGADEALLANMLIRTECRQQILLILRKIVLVIECLHVTEPGTATKKSGVRDQGSGIRGKKEEGADEALLANMLIRTDRRQQILLILRKIVLVIECLNVTEPGTATK